MVFANESKSIIHKSTDLQASETGYAPVHSYNNHGYGQNAYGTHKNDYGSYDHGSQGKKLTTLMFFNITLIFFEITLIFLFFINVTLLFRQMNYFRT